MKDISKHLKLKQVDSMELKVLLESTLSSHSSRGDLAKHRVIYGDNEMIITYKSKQRVIRKVEVCDGFEKEKLEKLITDIDECLIGDKGELQYVDFPLFIRPSSSIDLPDINFRYKDLFQIIPAPEGSPEPSYVLADHPIIIQFAYVKPRKGWLNAVRSSKVRNEIQLLLAALSPKLLGYQIKDTISSFNKFWGYMPHEEYNGFFPTQWCQVGYGYPKVNNECFVEVPNEALTNCPNLRSFLDAYFALSANDQEKYLGACLWYHKGIVAHNITDKFLNLIIMIESLLPNGSNCEQCGTYVKHSQKKCSECGECSSGITKSFKEFVSKYAGYDNMKHISDLYSLRSGIVHSAQTIANEGKGFSTGIIPEDTRQYNSVSALVEICRVILVKYLAELHNHRITNPI